MVFSSVIFLFGFLPVVLVLYHLVFLPVWLGNPARIWRHLANLLLLLVSLVFYFWGEKFLVWVFIATVLIDYLCALFISGAYRRGPYKQLPVGVPRTGLQKTVLATSICSNLAMLGYFKYFNFGVSTYNRILVHAGLSSATWNSAPNVLLPLGISFFVFHSMSYTIDVYRGYVKATRNLIDYAAYVLMFPQLVAGPIVRYSLVARQLVERRMTSAIFASGVARFIVGLAKKTLVANPVSVVADKVFALPANQVDFTRAWVGAIAYTLQIYFDFSGYSRRSGYRIGSHAGFRVTDELRLPLHSAISAGLLEKMAHIALNMVPGLPVYPPRREPKVHLAYSQ